MVTGDSGGVLDGSSVCIGCSGGAYAGNGDRQRSGDMKLTFK